MIDFSQQYTKQVEYRKAGRVRSRHRHYVQAACDWCKRVEYVRLDNANKRLERNIANGWPDGFYRCRQCTARQNLTIALNTRCPDGWNRYTDYFEEQHG